MKKSLTIMAFAILGIAGQSCNDQELNEVEETLDQYVSEPKSDDNEDMESVDPWEVPGNG